MHPWHDIEVGLKQPKVVNMVIEIPKKSTIKYELEKKTGLLKMDRFLYSSVYYPGDYGFIPRTLWEDNDPLDIIVFTREPGFPLAICEVKVIGVLEIIDENESDDKIIAVHQTDPRFSEWNSINDMPKHYLTELKHFFETYKELQGKKVEVFKILGVDEAYKAIEKGMKLYSEKFEIS